MQNIRRSFLTVSHNEPALKILLEEEKDVVQTLQKLSKEIGDTGTYLSKYGEKQHFDIKDISEQLSFITKHIETCIMDLSNSLQAYRENLKIVLRRQQELHDLEAKAKVSSEKMKKAQISNRPADRLQIEKEEIDAKLFVATSNFEGNKRAMLKGIDKFN